jgi:phosphatidylethanolamine/phosphatidyl-N-methylethanolamine N-methyltransferase
MKGLLASDGVFFLRAFLANPLSVAAVLPSGKRLARAVAAEIDPRPGGTVLELGPGTGAVTRAILESGIAPDDLAAIESDSEFAAALRRDFNRVRIIEGDALAFPALLARERIATPLRTIVSGIPVLSRPLAVRRKLLADAMEALKPGAPFVQFSYGAEPPLPACEGVEVRRAAIVWHNVPPMHVWAYRRAAAY